MFRFFLDQDLMANIFTSHVLKIENINLAKEIDQIYFIGYRMDSKRNDRIVKQIFKSNLVEINPKKMTKSQTNKESLRVY